MNTLIIERANDVPNIILDAENGVFEIKGRSFPEEIMDIYGPVMDWMANYVLKPNKETRFVFELEYFNSSTYKAILNLLMKLESIHPKQSKVQVIWGCRDRDGDMREAGEEFAEMVDVPFEYVTVQ